MCSPRTVGCTPLPKRHTQTMLLDSCWPVTGVIGQLLDNCWTVTGVTGQLLDNCWTVPGQLLELLNSCLPVVEQLLDNCWSVAGQLLDNCRTVAGQLLDSFWTVTGVTGQLLASGWTVTGQLLDSRWTVTGQLLDCRWSHWTVAGQLRTDSCRHAISFATPFGENRKQIECSVVRQAVTDVSTRSQYIHMQREAARKVSDCKSLDSRSDMVDKSILLAHDNASEISSSRRFGAHNPTHDAVTLAASRPTRTESSETGVR